MENKEFQFKTNINCGGCVASVKPHLDSAEGVRNVLCCRSGWKYKLLSGITDIYLVEYSADCSSSLHHKHSPEHKLIGQFTGLFYCAGFSTHQIQCKIDAMLNSRITITPK